MSCGLATTRRTLRRDWRSTSATQSVMKGSAVATTTSVGVTCTGSTGDARHRRRSWCRPPCPRPPSAGRCAGTPAGAPASHCVSISMSSGLPSRRAWPRWPGAPAGAGRFRPGHSARWCAGLLGEITPSALSHSTRCARFSGPRWAVLAREGVLVAAFMTIGLKTRSHLGAGRPQRVWMVSACCSKPGALGQGRRALRQHHGVALARGLEGPDSLRAKGRGNLLEAACRSWTSGQTG
jgi:hypothetical protein